MPKTRRISVAAAAMFFVSGAIGLIYQVVWSRLFNQVFGVTTYAVTAVLTTYLGGLALGAWLLGPLADRAARPLRLYGWLELGAAVTALGGAVLLRTFDPVHVWAANHLPPDSPALLLVRMALASAVVLPPTVLMGGTLPAMTRACVDGVGKVGARLSLLYGINTAGAVAGTLLAGFVLIGELGVHPTLLAAVAANALVAAAALLLGTLAPTAAVNEPQPHGSVAPGARFEPIPPAAKRGASWLLVAMALSGFASLTLEVLWTRLLVLVFGTSTYSFVTMLAAFLVGIALGSLLCRSIIDRLRDPRRAFGWVQVGIAASTLATVPAMRALVASGQRWFDGHEVRWVEIFAGRFGLSFLVMIVPTTLIGATFPLAARLWTRTVGDLGGRLGQLYGSNTFGNIAGAVVGTFLLLPVLGIQRAVAAVTVLNLVAAAWALWPAIDEGRRPVALLRTAPLLVGLLACALVVVLRHPVPFATSEDHEGDRVLYYREGLVSTVKVTQRADDARQLQMFVDGVRIGQSQVGVDRKQQVLAHFPFLLHPAAVPHRVLTVGLGSGILSGEVARHPGVERVDCIELSPSVIEGARAFAAYNGGVLERPGVRIIEDDGVNFLRRAPDRYDAIISDGKSRSGHAGNALFYSEEYYRSAREHLAPDGLMMQWIPLDVPARDLRIIVRTFLRAFPYAYLWLAQDSCFLVGREEPLAFDAAHVQRVLDAPETANLRRHGWQNAADVSALLVDDGPALASWLAGDDTVNSLERPVLEFYAPSELATSDARRESVNLSALAATWRGPLTTVRVAGGTPPRATEALMRLIAGLDLASRRDARGAHLLAAAAAGSSSGALQQWAALSIFDLARALDAQGESPAAADLYRSALSAWPDLVEAHINLGRLLAAQGRRAEAGSELLRATELNPESGAAHRALARLLAEVGDVDGAIRHASDAARIGPELADAHELLGLALALAGRVEAALPEVREAVRLAPNWPEPMTRLALLLTLRTRPTPEDVREAVRLARRATELTEGRDADALETLAATYAVAGDFQGAVASEQAAAALATATGDAPLAAAAAAALDLYQHGRTLPRELPAGGAPPAH